MRDRERLGKGYNVREPVNLHRHPVEGVRSYGFGPYRSAVGGPMRIAGVTRPDIANAAGDRPADTMTHVIDTGAEDPKS